MGLAGLTAVQTLALAIEFLSETCDVLGIEMVSEVATRAALISELVAKVEIILG